MSEESHQGEATEREDQTPRRRKRDRLGPLGSAVGLARIGAAAWWRTTIWTGAASARVGTKVIDAASSGTPPVELFRSTRDDITDYAQKVLGIVDPEDLKRAATEVTGRTPPERQNGVPLSLLERGAELLRHSADVNFAEDAHPAYARILEDLAPDEGRILRLLVLEGAQPSVDIRAGWIPLNSELIASGLSMIGEEAGCRHLGDIPAYLNNLFRLGLIWFSREPLSDPLRYQVLEAQPMVSDAMEEAGRSRTVRRSIELTPFGKDFCELCLPLETAEFEALGSKPKSNGEPDQS